MDNKVEFIDASKKVWKVLGAAEQVSKKIDYGLGMARSSANVRIAEAGRESPESSNSDKSGKMARTARTVKTVNMVKRMGMGRTPMMPRMARWTK
jgi:hypothetical protein